MCVVLDVPTDDPNALYYWVCASCRMCFEASYCDFDDSHDLLEFEAFERRAGPFAAADHPDDGDMQHDRCEGCRALPGDRWRYVATKTLTPKTATI